MARRDPNIIERMDMSLLSLIEHVTVLSVISASPGFAAEPAPDQPINLAGDWRFEIDRTDSGTAEAWFKKDLPGSISLPGSMSENGLGDPMKAIRQNTWGDGWTDKPVWHPQLKIDYRGKAWYQSGVRCDNGRLSNNHEITSHHTTSCRNQYAAIFTRINRVFERSVGK